MIVRFDASVREAMQLLPDEFEFEGNLDLDDILEKVKIQLTPDAGSM